MTALAGLRIIECTTRVTGEYAAKLLADFGAEVIKVEPPAGAPSRRMGPFSGGESTLFRYLNTNKTSVVFTPDSGDYGSDLNQLLSGADALIEDAPTPWPGAQNHPALVHTIITPFGQGAPAEWQSAQPINVINASGWGYHTPSESDPSRPPLKGPGRFLSDFEAGLDAALATAASLLRKRRTGLGQLIDIAEVDVLINRADCVLGRMLAGEIEPGPERTRYDMGGPGAAFPCKDGHVFLLITTRAHWQGLTTLMGDPDWATAFPEDWLEFHCTTDRVAAFRNHFRAWTATQAKMAVSEAAQKLGVALVPVNRADDLLSHPQYQHRGYFQTLDGALYPTVPYRMSASPVVIAKAAPVLPSPSRGVPQPAARVTDRLERNTKVRGPDDRSGPLAGIRILELTKVWAGPYAGKMLAHLGAEVIKIESASNLDEMRAYGGVDINSAPYFLSINQEVLSVQVNLKSDEGLGLLRRLIAESDVIIDNIRPGAMERAGLGYEALRKIKPDIIQASIKMYGNDGPLGYQTGYAPCFAALGGLTSLVGYEGETPTGMNIRYGDSTVGASAAFAVIAALLHRESTGEGQFIDVSAVETMSTMVGDSLFAAGLTGAMPGPDGNKHPEMDPHGCYPCADGEWISIAVANEAARDALHAILGEGDIAAQTATLDAATLADQLRRAGVAAFKSMSSLDLVGDEHLWSRETFRLVSDHKNGTRPIIAPSWRITPDPPRIERGAPLLGEHNEYVYRDLLGLSAEALTDLIARKVVD